MTPRVVFSIRKQTMHKIRAMKVHNHRLNPKDTRIRDPDKTTFNRTLYSKHDLPLNEAIKLEVSERHNTKRKIRSDAIVALEAVISASPSYFRPWDENDIGNYDPNRLKAWVKCNMKALRGKFGDNLIDVTLHLDEATPHIHAVIVPVDTTGDKNGNLSRFNAKRAH